MAKLMTTIFVFCLPAAALYVNGIASTNSGLYSTTFLLAFMTALAVTLVRSVAKWKSPTFILHLLFSAVGGLGLAVFFVACSKLLFDTPLPTQVSQHVRFMLPIVFSAFSFWSLRAHPWFQTEEAGANRGRRYIPDASALEDGRVVDLARLGMFDGRLFIPTFLLDELKLQSESVDEILRLRSRRAFDSIRRLESLPNVEFRVENCGVPTEVDSLERLIAVAHKKDAYVLTSETLPTKADEACTVLSLDCIAHALRPPIPKGEILPIKIQRIGKEPKQGIGYLEDGTMVVVNGGGDFLGRTVRTQVLSQKYSSSGKIVFCNVKEDIEDRAPSPAPYLVSVDINSS